MPGSELVSIGFSTRVSKPESRIRASNFNRQTDAESLIHISNNLGFYQVAKLGSLIQPSIPEKTKT